MATTKHLFVSIQTSVERSFHWAHKCDKDYVCKRAQGLRSRVVPRDCAQGVRPECAPRDATRDCAQDARPGMRPGMRPGIAPTRTAPRDAPKAAPSDAPSDAPRDAPRDAPTESPVEFPGKVAQGLRPAFFSITFPS